MELTFDEIVKEIKDFEPILMPAKLSSIKLEEDSIENNYILVDNNPLRVNLNFIKSLFSMLKLGNYITRDMIKKGNKSLAIKLINALKEYQSLNKKNENIVLIGDKKSKSLISISKKEKIKTINSESLIKIIESIMNESPFLKIEKVETNFYRNTLSINFLNSKEISFYKAGKDEVFKFGFSITKGIKDTYIESYNQRLICSNGLRFNLGSGYLSTHNVFEKRISINGSSEKDLKDFLFNLNLMKKNDYIPYSFNEALNTAISTKASLFEIESAYEEAKSYLVEKNEDFSFLEQYNLANKYFYPYLETINRLKSKKIDHNQLTSNQKRKIMTNATVWDVVNSLTYLGSNDSEFEFNGSQSFLKNYAGMFFSKVNSEGTDLQNIEFLNI